MLRWPALRQKGRQRAPREVLRRDRGRWLKPVDHRSRVNPTKSWERILSWTRRRVVSSAWLPASKSGQEIGLLASCSAFSGPSSLFIRRASRTRESACDLRARSFCERLSSVVVCPLPRTRLLVGGVEDEAAVDDVAVDSVVE